MQAERQHDAARGNRDLFAVEVTFTPVAGTLPANGLTIVAAATGTFDNLWILRAGGSVSELDELIY